MGTRATVMTAGANGKFHPLDPGDSRNGQYIVTAPVSEFIVTRFGQYRCYEPDTHVPVEDPFDGQVDVWTVSDCDLWT
jgi:hypothetical protein